MKKLILIAASSLFFAGCATILNDETQRISVTTSNNKEVKGNIDGIPFTAPSIVSVKRSKSDKIINIENSACTKQTLLASQVDLKFFINVLTGGTTGSTTDYATEKMWKFQENVIIPCQ